ncbi:MAG: ABC transporter ATP-binding protein [Candidatus Magnetoovum sp. WYHC-5]|nr:ABC transporter ATP-binding protein [Candidatus Magnetoovum sp. WYHC-5]
MSVCVMQGVTKRFQVDEIYIDVLRGIDLKIEGGDFTAVMGASGSGKSTLMNILGCLDTPTSGKYFLAGRDVSALNDDELSLIRNELIGFVFQQFYLLHYATVIENVLLPTIYRHGKNSREKTNLQEIALELLKTVGLHERAKFRPRQLSGGQQQRVAIARALINDPELIICDEPTGQLDSNTSKGIMAILKELNERGKTIVVVTHDSQVAAHAKKILYISDGMIVDK